MENTKKCTKCLRVKSFESYSPFKTGRFGLNPKCKSCNALYVKSYRKSHPKKMSLKQLIKKRNESMLFYKKNRDRILKRQRKFEKSCLFCKKLYMAFYKKQKCCSKKCLGMIFRRNINEYLRTNNIRAHRVVMENLIGRKLNSKEVVHHINGNKRDNRPENLMLFPNNKSHMEHHYKIRKESKIENLSRHTGGLSS